jgi:hypothetical protein
LNNIHLLLLLHPEELLQLLPVLLPLRLALLLEEHSEFCSVLLRPEIPQESGQQQTA